MPNTSAIGKLEQQRAALTKKIKAAKEQQRREVNRTDDKRHAIIGKLLLKEAAKNTEIKGIIDTLLRTKLTRKTDRALFDLPPLIRPVQTDETENVSRKNPG